MSVIASEAEVKEKQRCAQRGLSLSAAARLIKCVSSVLEESYIGWMFFKVCEQSCVFVLLSGKLQNLLKSCCHLSFTNLQIKAEL